MPLHPSLIGGAITVFFLVVITWVFIWMFRIPPLLPHQVVTIRRSVTNIRTIVVPIIGSVLILLGLALMFWTNRLFATVGKGTLAPWNPPQRLVVRGAYRYVRNPMMTGVFCILLGESLIFGSLWLLGWFGFFVAVTVTVIPVWEEPRLAKRFGQDYLLYKRNVPRWIPRLTAREGLSE